ncbi:hypothetical protein [Azospirillum sp. sgz302134]
MTVHRLFAAALLSTAFLTSGASFAATHEDAPTPGSFTARLDEAKDVVRNDHTRNFERYQRTEIDRYLTQAESLSDQGSQAKAEQFLTFARNMLGLRSAPNVRISQR